MATIPMQYGTIMRRCIMCVIHIDYDCVICGTYCTGELNDIGVCATCDRDFQPRLVDGVVHYTNFGSTVRIVDGEHQELGNENAA